MCIRDRFGNVLGAFVIMELLKAIIPVIVPIPFSFYFDIFDGLLQAYVLSLIHISLISKRTPAWNRRHSGAVGLFFRQP